jgi:hypothetical protein
MTQAFPESQAVLQALPVIEDDQFENTSDRAFATASIDNLQTFSFA